MNLSCIVLMYIFMMEDYACILFGSSAFIYMINKRHFEEVIYLNGCIYHMCEKIIVNVRFLFFSEIHNLKILILDLLIFL